MPKREQLLQSLQPEDMHAAFLLAQAGGVPNELQLIVETAQYDAEKEALIPQQGYIIRVLGTLEFRIDNLGATVEQIQLLDDHPLLDQYNKRPAALFFRGQPNNVYELIVDISQAHASTFRGYRAFPTYLNVSQPLVELFQSDGGLVGQMPLSFAQKLEKVLQHHGLETKIIEGEEPEPIAKGVYDNLAQVLLIGTSYFVSYSFSVEELAKR